MGGSHSDVPWRKLITSRSVLLLWIQYFCSTFPWYFYITLVLVIAALFASFLPARRASRIDPRKALRRD